MNVWDSINTCFSITLITLIIVRLAFRVKNIKNIRVFRISLPIIIVTIFAIVAIVDLIILPLPSYYIKAKDEKYIENIIMDEMERANIKYDEGSIRIVSNFIGRYNQLYLCKYEINGVEKARLFDFEQNIFGNLKPSRDFSKSKLINSESKLSFRKVVDGLSTYDVAYGYSEGESLFTDVDVGKFKIASINPEGYYLLIERYDYGRARNLCLKAIILALFIFYKSKEERNMESYTVTKVPGKKIDVLAIEYFR